MRALPLLVVLAFLAVPLTLAPAGAAPECPDEVALCDKVCVGDGCLVRDPLDCRYYGCRPPDLP